MGYSLSQAEVRLNSATSDLLGIVTMEQAISSALEEGRNENRTPQAD